MTTPREVNKALAKMGAKHTIHRNLLGGSYYYFSTQTENWEVPSIYAYSLAGYTTEEVVAHYVEARDAAQN